MNVRGSGAWQLGQQNIRSKSHSLRVAKGPRSKPGEPHKLKSEKLILPTKIERESSFRSSIKIPGLGRVPAGAVRGDPGFSTRGPQGVNLETSLSPSLLRSLQPLGKFGPCPDAGPWSRSFVIGGRTNLLLPHMSHSKKNQFHLEKFNSAPTPTSFF